MKLVDALQKFKLNVKKILYQINKIGLKNEDINKGQ